MYKIENVFEMFKDVDGFIKCLQIVGIKSHYQNDTLYFPEISFSEDDLLRMKGNSFIDVNLEDITFEVSRILETVPLITLPSMNVGFGCESFLTKIDMVLQTKQLKLVDIDTNSEIYCYFITTEINEDGSEAETLEDYFINAVSLLKDIFEKNKENLKGTWDLELADIMAILNSKTKAESANIYLLKDLLEKVDSESVYSISEEDGSFIKCFDVNMDFAKIMETINKNISDKNADYELLKELLEDVHPEKEYTVVKDKSKTMIKSEDFEE